MALACAAIAFGIVALAGAAGMRAAGEDPIDAGAYGFVVDREGIDPGDSARVGLVARDGAARFDDFALWLAE
jgi:hypothetical protein